MALVVAFVCEPSNHRICPESQTKKLQRDIITVSKTDCPGAERRRGFSVA